jgi:hypothetical protein
MRHAAGSTLPCTLARRKAETRFSGATGLMQNELTPLQTSIETLRNNLITSMNTEE